jgi:hypothetical protein
MRVQAGEGALAGGRAPSAARTAPDWRLDALLLLASVNVYDVLLHVHHLYPTIQEQQKELCLTVRTEAPSA